MMPCVGSGKRRGHAYRREPEMPATCRIFLPPPNIPLFGQSPGMYGSLAVAMFSLVAGWLLYGIGLNHAAPALARVDWNRGARAAHCHVSALESPGVQLVFCLSYGVCREPV